MTTPAERTNAVINMGRAIQSLAPYLHGRGETVRVPRETLRDLFALLRHYPTPGEMFKPGESVKQPAEESNEVNGATLKDIAASLHNPFPANGRCPRCGVEMVVGMALESTVTGSPDFIGGEVVTLSPGGPGKLVACMKCIGCGYSTT